jgi:tetratricopeptide (TPR) repeat protein
MRDNGAIPPWSAGMHELPIGEVSARALFAQLLRQLLDRGGLTQATLARRLRQQGIAQVTEPRVSDWVHGRNLPREEAVVFAIESVLTEAGVAVASGELIARYWAARREPRHSPGIDPAQTRTAMASGEPGVRQPAFPGELPTVWNVPRHPNPYFVGRDATLAEAHDRLTAADVTRRRVVLTGLGGVGKSQLAAEYAYRHRTDYDLVWWVRGTQPTSLSSDYAALAGQPPLADLKLGRRARQELVLAAVRGWLERHDGWLLVIDDVDDPQAVADLLPRSGTGHVIITSRTGVGWERLGTWLAVEVLAADDAARFLLARIGETELEMAADARRLASTLGGLPLALEQAGAYVAATGTVSLAGYAELFTTRSSELLERGQPLDYQDTVATTWSLTLQRLRQSEPAAVGLLSLAAFLAPDDLPQPLLSAHHRELPEPLATAAGDPLALGDAIAALRRFSLVRVVADGLFIHPLLQAVVQAALEDDEAERSWAAAAIRLLRAGFPGATSEAASWADCERLLPHVLVAAEHSRRRGIEPEQGKRLLKQSATYLQNRGYFSQSKLLVERIVASNREDLGDDHPETLAWTNNLGQVLHNLGDRMGVRELHEQALRGFQQVLGEDHPATLVSMDGLALALRFLGDFDGAQALHEQALAGFRRVLGEDHPATLVSMNNVAEIYRHRGDLRQAHQLHERTLRAMRRVLGDDHRHTLTSMNNLAVTRRALGDLQGAMQLHEQALAGFQRMLGDDHQRTLISLTNLGELQRHLGDPQRAFELHELALTGLRRARGDDHAETLSALDHLALASHMLGDLEGAHDLHKQALTRREQALGREGRHTLASSNNLAETQRALGDLQSAGERHAHTLDAYRRVLGDHHPETLTSMDNLASTYRALGDLEAARRLHEEAVAGFRQILGDDHPDTLRSMTNLGEVLWELAQR